MDIYTIVWIGSTILILIVLGYVIVSQIANDLNSNQNQTEKKRINPFQKDNDSERREDSIYEQLDPYLSLLSVVFSLLIFLLIYNLYIEDFYDHASNIRENLGYATAPFFLTIIVSSSFITRTFMREIIMENKAIKVARGKSVVITALSFIFYLLLFSFFHQIGDDKYNLIKGVSISFTIGVLFYIIFGKIIKIPFLNLKRNQNN